MVGAFMVDDNLKHTFKLVEAYFHDKKIKVWLSPLQSNLTPINNLLNELKKCKR